MNLDLKKLQRSLCTALCADIHLAPQNGRVAVVTPFLFPDGDPYLVYLEELPGGTLRLTDAGHTMMHLSYDNDIDKFYQGTRGGILEKILAQSDVSESEGEFYLTTTPDELGHAILRLSHTLTSINDLTFLNRARAESTFYEDLAEILNEIVPAEILTKEYIYEGMNDANVYPIDYRVEGKPDPLFLFGIPNKDKARLVTIVLGRLLRAQAQFDSVLIFADQGAIPRPDLARLSNVGGEMISSLDAEDDLRRKVARRAA